MKGRERAAARSRQLDECLSHPVRPLRAFAALDLGEGRLEGKGTAIRAIGGHGIEGIGHRQDLRCEVEAPQPPGIAFAVQALVVGKHQLLAPPVFGKLGQDIVANLRMATHDCPFLGGEPAGLV